MQRPKFTTPPSNPLGAGKREFAKSTKEEVRARVLFVGEMLATGWRKGEITAWFKAQYGVSYRTTARYMRLARKQMANRLAELSQGDLVAESFSLYQSIIKNPKSTMREKILARKAIDNLLGLQAPRKVAPTNIAGDEPYTLTVKHIDQAAEKMTDEQLEAIASLRRIANGTSVNPN